MSPQLQGISLRLASTFCGAALAAGVHAIKDVPLGQLMFWRSLMAMIPIIAYIAWRRELRTVWRTDKPLMHFTRGLLGTLAMVFFFSSLFYLPVSNASAIGYLSPLLSLPFAAAFLGETMRKAIIFACILGFLGVLALLYPSMSGPSVDTDTLVGVAFALAFAVTMAMIRIQVKTLTKTEPTSTIAFYFAIVSTSVGAASFVLGWVPLDRDTMWILLFIGIMGGLAHITATEAAAHAPVSVLAPFDYTGLVWALGFDLILFSYRPDIWSLVGVTAITTAGLMMVFNDRKPVRIIKRP